MSFLVTQLGARMHYAVPRMLHAAGMLAGLCTDICGVQGWPRLLAGIPSRFRPAGVRRLLGRIPEGVPARKIRAFSTFGWQYARRRAAAQTAAELTAAYLWAGRQFCDLVLRHGLGDARSVYTFNSAGLEVLRHARKRGVRAVMEQTIAPRLLEQRLLGEEHERFPGWELPPAADGPVAEYCARESAEWEEADLILCGSEFVREGIAACSGPVERCVVVHYGVDSRFSVPERSRHGGPLRVLTVGAVGLRKGAPYVLEAARQLQGRAEFRMVGPTAISESARQELSRHVQVHGPVPRTEIVDQFAWADVFLLPSICEGSATVTYEALACGLPVVCTPNTGSVVRDGIDGFIVPVRDGEAIAEKLELFARSADLRREMARRAQEQAAEYTLAKYGERLLQSLETQHAGCLLAAQ